MSALRNALLGLAALGAMAAPPLAQAPGSYDCVMLYYPDTGRMVMGHLDKAAMDMAMKHAKALAAIKKAAEVGVGMVAVHNSRHFGAAGGRRNFGHQAGQAMRDEQGSIGELDEEIEGEIAAARAAFAAARQWQDSERAEDRKRAAGTPS